MSHKNHQKLRLGIVGAGEVVRRRHLPALQRHPDVEIVAISNSTYESSEKFCRRTCAARDPDDELGGVARHSRDSTSSGSAAPPYIHSAVTVSALEAGKHVFCQARMAMDLAEAEEMLSGLASFSRAGHNALSAALRNARRSARAKAARGERRSVSHTTCVCRA